MTPHPTAPLESPRLARAALAATLADLVAINSVNPNYGGPAGGERRVLEQIAGILRAAGLQPRLEPSLPPDRPILRVRLESETPAPALLFESHVDTVSISGMSIPPFEPRVEDGRLYGRGSTDAKGQVVALLHAFLAWAEGPRRPPRPIELAFVVDEEFGFGGARALAAARPDVAAIVIAEPTDLRVVTAHKGSLRFDVTLHGRPAHAAKPHLGVNAISAAAALVAEIDGHYTPLLAARSAPLLGAPTINTSIVEGGVQYNLVPPSCTLKFDRRIIPGETAASVRAEFMELFSGARRRFPDFSATLSDPVLDAPCLWTEPDSPHVRAACAVAGRMGLDSAPLGVDYATDACALVALGCPILIAGPGSIDQAHTADEWIDLAELERGARFYTELIAEPWA